MDAHEEMIRALKGDEPMTNKYKLVDVDMLEKILSKVEIDSFAGEPYIANLYAPIRALLEAAPPADVEPVGEPVVELWQALGKWSAYLTSSPTCLADLAPPDYLIQAINNATTQPPADKDAERIAIEELERALCVIGVVSNIDGHDVIRRDSVIDITRDRIKKYEK